MSPRQAPAPYLRGSWPVADRTLSGEAPERFQHAFATGEAWANTFPPRGQDGGHRWVRARAVALRGTEGDMLRYLAPAPT